MAALLGVAASTPACCCGGVPAPRPGPPGSISGRLVFPENLSPAPLVVYAMDMELSRPLSMPYLATHVIPPATTYRIAAPPGEYQIAARLDSDPLMGAGYVACHSTACTPGYLQAVRVEAKANVRGIDITDWGSLHAADLLLQIDAFGSPMPVPSETSPYPSPVYLSSPPALPIRQRPQGPATSLGNAFTMPSYFYARSSLSIRLDLPAGWHEIQPPVSSTNNVDFYYASEDVLSPMSLDSNGIFLVLHEDPYCLPFNLTGATAQASFFNTPQGMANFYFRDSALAAGQPYHGFEYFGTKNAAPGCFYMDFTGAQQQARDSNLRVFDQIIFQARYL